VTCTSPANPQPEPTEYFVSLADAPTHSAHVSIRLHGGGRGTTLNLPVWNALYQVRNFAVDVANVHARDHHDQAIAVLQSGTSAWQIDAAEPCIVVSYDVHLDSAGPFGSQLDAEHGFFNWAMVLMYSTGLRNSPVSIRLLDVPAAWALRDTYVFGGAGVGKVQDAIGVAANYDTLADSPALLGNFQETSFRQDGAIYHMVVHPNPANYDSQRLQGSLQRITHAAVDWMQDRPFNEYTFLYDFPRGPAHGGMEHAYGTAISASAASGKVNTDALANISAHEFFHLWNVKRIRPQSLEPIDYQHEQETRALWFSEGLTSTVGELLLARAGVINERQYLEGIAAEITELERRPAHVWQSAENSSLEAWFEGNAYYRSPERSISYYNKGEILGVLLDLRIRELTQGAKSLRDLFQWMNDHYAKQHRFFPDSAGVQEAAEAITGESFADFFRDYVADVKPIPYNDYFRFVGLQLVTENVTVADPGFASTGNLDGQTEVTTVSPGSNAARAGLKVGDHILEVNGQPVTYRLDREIARMMPGQTIKLRITGKEQTLKIKVGERQEQQYALADVIGVTLEQLAHRTAWIHGDDESGGVH